jgi:hypothetical protein
MTALKFGWVDDYATVYNRTESPEQDLTRADLPELNVPRALHASLGLASELAEFEEATTTRHRLEELGDLVWFTTLLADSLAMDRVKLWESAVYRSENTIYDRDRPGLMVELSHAVGSLCDRVKAALFYRSVTLKPFYAHGQEFKSEKVPAMDALRVCAENIATCVTRLGDGLAEDRSSPGAGLRLAMTTNLAKLEVRHNNQAAQSDDRDYAKEALAMDRSADRAQHEDRSAL